MLEVHASGLGVPILSFVDSSGFAIVVLLHLSNRFDLQDHSIWIKCKDYNPATLLLLLTMRESSYIAENGLCVWHLALGRYKIYRLAES